MNDITGNTDRGNVWKHGRKAAKNKKEQKNKKKLSKQRSYHLLKSFVGKGSSKQVVAGGENEVTGGFV